MIRPRRYLLTTRELQLLDEALSGFVEDCISSLPRRHAAVQRLRDKIAGAMTTTFEVEEVR